MPRSISERPASELHAPRLVIATGGLSIPPPAPRDCGYEVAKQFGIPVTPLAPDWCHWRWMRLSLSATACCPVSASTASRTATTARHLPRSVVLIHRGLPGPAVPADIQLLEARRDGALDLLPDRDADAWLTELRSRKGTAPGFAKALAAHLPKSAWRTPGHRACARRRRQGGRTNGRARRAG